jgi:hypothetical protein
MPANGLIGHRRRKRRRRRRRIQASDVNWIFILLGFYAA